MSKPKSTCPVCREPVRDMLKRFDETLGYICPDCHGFLLYADKALRKHGIEDVARSPRRFTPSNSKPETP